MRLRKTQGLTALTRLVLAGWLGVILLLTLSPHNTQTQAAGDNAVARAERRVDVPGRVPARFKARQTDLVGNVLLFVPLGFLGAIAFPRKRALVVAGGVVLAAGVELMQAVFITTRTGSVTDVATNATGHLFGVGVALVAAALVGFHR